VDEQIERAPVAQPDRRKVPDVSRREAPDAEIFGERYDGCVHEAKAEIGIASVNGHGARKLIDGRCVREGAACDVIHEHAHRRPLVPKEVVQFRQNQAWNVARTRTGDGVAKTPMIWSGFNQIVEKRPGIADQRGGRANDRHQTARARRPARARIE